MNSREWFERIRWNCEVAVTKGTEPNITFTGKGSLKKAIRKRIDNYCLKNFEWFNSGVISESTYNLRYKAAEYMYIILNESPV